MQDAGHCKSVRRKVTRFKDRSVWLVSLVKAQGTLINIGGLSLGEVLMNSSMFAKVQRHISQQVLCAIVCGQTDDGVQEGRDVFKLTFQMNCVYKRMKLVN